MPYYESVFIARQDVSAPQVEALADQITKVIEDHGGSVGRKEFWGLRSLAYKIKKNRKGHYVLINIDAPAEAVIEMERQMRLNEDVLRTLTVRVDALEDGPSAMMQQRPEREGRRGRPGGDRRPPGDRAAPGERPSNGGTATADKDSSKSEGGEQ